MSGLFGSKKAVSSTAPVISSLSITTATYGRPVPILYGRVKVAAWMLWYGDFQAIPVSSSSNSGGKGGGGASSGPQSYNYQAAVVLGLCEGQINEVISIWNASDYYTTTALVPNVPFTKCEQLFTDPTTGQVTLSPPSLPITMTSVVCVGASGWGDGGVADVGYTLSGNVLQVTSSANYGKAIQVVYSYLTTTTASPLSDINGTPFYGVYWQTPWSYLSSSHPDQADSYHGIAYVGCAPLQLGSDASFPNLSFEVDTQFGFSTTIRDCNPRDVIQDYLTNPYYGANYSLNGIGDWSDFSNYCVASGLFFSPDYTEQEAASDVMTRIMALTNCEFVASDKILKIVPYADQPVTGNGVTWTPNLTAIYDITIDQLMPNGDMGPLSLARKAPDQRFNDLKVDFTNRAIQYNSDVVEVKDEAEIFRNGLRMADSDTQATEIKDAGVATIAGNLILQRAINVCNVYTFKLQANYCALEPMDLITLTYASLGLAQALVRINEIAENDDESLTLTCEEVPIGHATAITYPYTTAAGYNQNYNLAATNIATPFFFECPIEDGGNSGLAVWAAVTGATEGLGWGGATVWASLDGISFTRQGAVYAGSRYGTITSGFVGTGAETINVALAGQGGQMLSGSVVDARLGGTLCYVENAGYGEFIGYTTATLLSANNYSLVVPASGRGVLDSTPPAPTSGTTCRFARLDDTIYQGASLPLSMIGTPLYFKFTSFNAFGGGEQSLADVPAYSYTIKGNILAVPPNPVTGLSASFEPFGIRLTCNQNTEVDVVGYEFRVGSTFATATVIQARGGTNMLYAVQVAGTYTFWARAVDSTGNYSTPVSATCTVTVPSVTGLSQQFQNGSLILQWGNVPGSFAIDGYQIYKAGVPVAYLSTNQYSEVVRYGGSVVYGVAAVDVKGNIGTPATIGVTIAPPNAPTSGRADVIDNNALLYWNGSPGSLPIDHYEVRVGSSFAAGTSLGSNGNSTFAAVFEEASGTYTFWIAATDTAGNTGTAASIVATINQPPDYILRNTLNLTLAGTVVECFNDGLGIVGPIDATKTWSTHFSSNSWSSPNDQYNAGDHLYLEPGLSNPAYPTSGYAASYYSETIDYGAILPATQITVTPNTTIIDGSAGITPEILYSSDGSTYTSCGVGIYSAFLPAGFRYIIVKFYFSGGGGSNLIRINSCNVKLSNKLKTDSGTGTITSASAGVVVNFAVAFVEADLPIVQPAGSTPLIPVINYVSVPNPTSFTVYLYNLSGSPVTGSFSWTARGY